MIRPTVVVVKYIDQLCQCRLIIVVVFLPRHTCYSCISPSLISSFLFLFRFPVIHFENFCLTVNRLRSGVKLTSVILTPVH